MPNFRFWVDDSEVKEFIARWPMQAAGASTKTQSRLYDEFQRWMSIAVASWEHKPSFEVTVHPVRWAAGQSFVSMTIDPSDPSREDPFVWVDQGVEGPYPIVPVNARALRFQSSYKAKTVMGSALGSLPGGKSGPYVYRKYVEHKGFEPREIMEKVADVLEDAAESIFLSELDKALASVF